MRISDATASDSAGTACVPFIIVITVLLWQR
jgi:hypothetical protein